MRILKALLIWGIITGVSAYAQAPPAAKVVVSKINFQTKAQNRSFIGTFYYERISNISSEFSGLVEKVDASTGDKIKKGDPLVYLDTEILEKEISILENTLAQAALSIEHSKKNYQRMDALVKKGGISEKDFDDANYVYQDALLKQQSTRIMLEKLLIQKRKSIIYAPFDGIVLEKNIDSGDWVQQGKSLMSIGSVKDLFIKVPVAETLLQFIRINQSVPVTINADNREIKGTIENFSPIADANTKNVFLKIRIPLLTRVAQNMSATIYIPIGKQQELAMIPRDALVKFQGSDVIYTVKDNKAMMMPVNIVAYQGNEIGADNEYFFEGMKVVVDGNERLSPDQSVVIVGD